MIRSDQHAAPGDLDTRLDTKLEARLQQVLPVLESHAEEADWNSRLPSSSVDALRATGMFRLGVPREHGGFELGLVTALELASRIATRCPSSAWVVMATYAAQHLASRFDQQARTDLWAANPDGPLCGSFNGVGLVARRVEGGQVVSGRWPWASGCYHANWAILGVPIMSTDGVAPERGLALFSVAELSIEDTWDMVGMRGTGSATLVADEVFVSDQRIRHFGELLSPVQLPQWSIYDIPAGSMVITLLAPALGATRALLDLVLAATGKPMAMSVYPRRADSPSVQAGIAEAAILLDSAQLHLDRSARLLETSALGGIPVSLVERTRVRADVGHAANCLKRAVSLLLAIGGASGMATAHPIQRFWRDIHTGLSHPTLNEGLSREMYGRALVGIEAPLSSMV